MFAKIDLRHTCGEERRLLRLCFVSMLSLALCAGLIWASSNGIVLLIDGFSGAMIGVYFFSVRHMVRMYREGNAETAYSRTFDLDSIRGFLRWIVSFDAAWLRGKHKASA